MVTRRFFSDVSRYFDRAAALTDYPSDLLDQIKRCNSLYRFDFPVRQLDGVPVGGAAQPDVRAARE